MSQYQQCVGISKPVQCQHIYGIKILSAIINGFDSLIIETGGFTIFDTGERYLDQLGYKHGKVERKSTHNQMPGVCLYYHDQQYHVHSYHITMRLIGRNKHFRNCY